MSSDRVPKATEAEDTEELELLPLDSTDLLSGSIVKLMAEPIATTTAHPPPESQHVARRQRPLSHFIAFTEEKDIAATQEPFPDIPMEVDVDDDDEDDGVAAPMPPPPSTHLERRRSSRRAIIPETSYEKIETFDAGETLRGSPTFVDRADSPEAEVIAMRERRMSAIAFDAAPPSQQTELLRRRSSLAGASRTFARRSSHQDGLFSTRLGRPWSALWREAIAYARLQARAKKIVAVFRWAGLQFAARCGVEDNETNRRRRLEEIAVFELEHLRHTCHTIASREQFERELIEGLFHRRMPPISGRESGTMHLNVSCHRTVANPFVGPAKAGVGEGGKTFCRLRRPDDDVTHNPTTEGSGRHNDGVQSFAVDVRDTTQFFMVDVVNESDDAVVMSFQMTPQGLPRVGMGNVSVHVSWNFLSSDLPRERPDAADADLSRTQDARPSGGQHPGHLDDRASDGCSSPVYVRATRRVVRADIDPTPSPIHGQRAASFTQAPVTLPPPHGRRRLGGADGGRGPLHRSLSQVAVQRWVALQEQSNPLQHDDADSEAATTTTGAGSPRPHTPTTDRSESVGRPPRRESLSRLLAPQLIEPEYDHLVPDARRSHSTLAWYDAQTNMFLAGGPHTPLHNDSDDEECRGEDDDKAGTYSAGCRRAQRHASLLPAVRRLSRVSSLVAEEWMEEHLAELVPERHLSSRISSSRASSRAASRGPSRAEGTLHEL